MIVLKFTINPFRGGCNQTGIARNWVCVNRKLSKNKTFEFQVGNMGLYSIVDLDIDLSTTGKDHAGPTLFFSLLGIFLNINVCDHRHWDYTNNKWQEWM